MTSTRNLPSINSLRVVIGLAERGSTTACARALHLTQSAVSKQLLALEEVVGAKLFIRSARGLVLTNAGEVLVPQARLALSALETATMRIAKLSASPHITLHILPIFGDRWLVPRLSSFSDTHPDIEIELATFATTEQIDEAEAAFRFGAGKWDGQKADYLFGCEVALVAAPLLLIRMGGFTDASDFCRYPLLAHLRTPVRWEEFGKAQGLETDLPLRIINFGFYALVIRAAIAGQGLALVPRRLIAEELATGRLINPLELGFDSGNGYWLTYPIGKPLRPAMQLFRAWVLDQSAK